VHGDKVVEPNHHVAYFAHLDFLCTPGPRAESSQSPLCGGVGKELCLERHSIRAKGSPVNKPWQSGILSSPEESMTPTALVITPDL
jgi:hypothetical protein